MELTPTTMGDGLGEEGGDGGGGGDDTSGYTLRGVRPQGVLLNRV